MLSGLLVPVPPKSPKILLLRPPSPNDRFGLGPFFSVEPLGLLVLAGALDAEGYPVAVVDLRVERSLEAVLKAERPEVVGVSCMHTIDIDTTLATARTVKRICGSVPVLVGGHVASLYPEPFADPAIDAIALGCAESTLGAAIRALVSPAPRPDCRGFLIRQRQGAELACFSGERSSVVTDFTDTPIPRELLARTRRRYVCVHKQPIWAVETARGCPFRCNFCSSSAFSGRRSVLRPLEAVVDDLFQVGKNVFIVDDLFFSPTARSLDLARRLTERGLHKQWMLVQTRLDLIAKHPELLAAWRPLAQDFDLFLGFEAPTDGTLAALHKDMTLSAVHAGVAAARAHGFGVTGNFVVDPRWGEEEFAAVRQLVLELGLSRLGFTILTPLPGTELFAEVEAKLGPLDFTRFDMNHLMFEPRLGRTRFFELFAGLWRTNVLSSQNATRRIFRWARGLGPREWLTLLRVLVRSQRLVSPRAYLAEHGPGALPFSTFPPAGSSEPV